jgi:4-carboxymuconolactone decarboxylase
MPDILDGAVEPGRVFDRTIGLDETPDGYRAMDRRAALKVVVRPWPCPRCRTGSSDPALPSPPASQSATSAQTRGPHMSDTSQQTPAQKLIGDFAPKLVSLTDDVLFGDVWARPELSPRDRSLITVASLITGGNTEQLSGHLLRAKDNGLTEAELKEVIIHLAFYAGWPKAMSAITVAKQVFGA